MGKGTYITWWLWVLSGANGVVFDLQPSRGSNAGRALLDGFDGTLVADGYAVYASLERAFSRTGEQLALDGNALPQPDFTLAMCWMHARRGFIQAAKKGAIEAEEPLDWIGELYAIEAMAAEGRIGSVDRASKTTTNRTKSRAGEPVGGVVRSPARSARHPTPSSHRVPASPMAKPEVFLDDPAVPLDNGTAERHIRGPVVGGRTTTGPDRNEAPESHR